MRRFVALCALIACTAASPSDEGQAEGWSNGPDFAEITRSVEDSQQVCRDRVHRVREERGLPDLEQDMAEPEEPLFIAAVDHRIDGCSVLVMRNDTNDVRPIPKPVERAPLLRRIQ